MVFVDDIRITDLDSQLDLAAPQRIDHIVYLKSSEAGARFGTGAAGGVLLIYTKDGRPRPR